MAKPSGARPSGAQLVGVIGRKRVRIAVMRCRSVDGLTPNSSPMAAQVSPRARRSTIARSSSLSPRSMRSTASRSVRSSDASFDDESSCSAACGSSTVSAARVSRTASSVRRLRAWSLIASMRTDRTTVNARRSACVRSATALVRCMASMSRTIDVDARSLVMRSQPRRGPRRRRILIVRMGLSSIRSALHCAASRESRARGDDGWFEVGPAINIPPLQVDSQPTP